MITGRAHHLQYGSRHRPGAGSTGQPGEGCGWAPCRTVCVPRSPVRERRPARRDRIAEFEMHRNGPLPLTRAVCWKRLRLTSFAPLMEALDLPRDVTAVCNAKGSTGRVDCLTRVIVDGGTEFDRIPAGYTGPLYAEICPRSFSVKVAPGRRLNRSAFAAVRR